jgi:hypothetical protein
MPTECPFPFAFTFSELTFMNAIHELGQLLISGIRLLESENATKKAEIAILKNNMNNSKKIPMTKHVQNGEIK